MTKYNVIGEQAVGGVDPGGVVSLNLPAENIAALIAAGNIEPVRPTSTSSSADKKPEPKSAAKDGD